jgi:hypothetical protein
MNNRKQNHVVTVACLLLIVLACVGPSAAQPPIKKDRPERINPGPPACTADDKVAVTSFRLTPQELAVEGQVVVETMKITSKCPGGTADLDVPWKIYADGQMISSGNVRISAGDTATVSSSWTALVGSHSFFGSADPRNERARNNNTLPDVVMNVRPRSTSANRIDNTPPQLETQVLDYQKAKDAGAQFSDGVAGATICNPIGQYDPTGSPDSSGNSVGFRIVCSNIITGARANPEAFINFRLKNNWKIKSVDTSQIDLSTCTGANWQWQTRPSEGTDNPYMQMHLVSEPFQCLVRAVKITIEGPAGTNPYHN